MVTAAVVAFVAGGAVDVTVGVLFVFVEVVCLAASSAFFLAFSSAFLPPTEIDNLEQTKKDLEAEKLNLSMKVEEQEKRREEKSVEIEQLNVKMTDTQYEIDRID